MILLFKMPGMEEFDMLHELNLQKEKRKFGLHTGYILDIRYWILDTSTSTRLIHPHHKESREVNLPASCCQISNIQYPTSNI